MTLRINEGESRGWSELIGSHDLHSIGFWVWYSTQEVMELGIYNIHNLSVAVQATPTGVAILCNHTSLCTNKHNLSVAMQATPMGVAILCNHTRSSLVVNIRLMF